MKKNAFETDVGGIATTFRPTKMGTIYAANYAAKETGAGILINI